MDNAARAHLLALDEIRGEGRSSGRTYFISNGEPLPQSEIIRGLLGAAGIEAEIRPLAPGIAHMAGATLETAWKLLRIKNEPPLTRWSAEQLSTAHWYDISAARRDLGYEPLVSIADGLRLLREHIEQLP